MTKQHGIIVTRDNIIQAISHDRTSLYHSPWYTDSIWVVVRISDTNYYIGASLLRYNMLMRNCRSRVLSLTSLTYMLSYFSTSHNCIFWWDLADLESNWWQFSDLESTPISVSRPAVRRPTVGSHGRIMAKIRSYARFCVPRLIKQLMILLKQMIYFYG